MKSLERLKAIELRQKQQLGYGEIAKRLGVSKSTLSRWLEDLPLSDERVLELRRKAWTKGEVKRQKFRQTMREKRAARDSLVYESAKRNLRKLHQQSLHVAGLMLYAAEGDKKTRAEIAFANTDPAMVLFFARWLERFLGIPQEKLRIQLHLYEDMDIRKEEGFWKTYLSMDTSQVCKSQVRPLRPGSFTYKGSFRHGTCKLYVGGVQKKSELMLSIRAFFDTYSEHLQV
jgi:transcriptional regulator with XRE-family HTH domain